MTEDQIIEIVKQKCFYPENRIEKIEKKEDGRFLIFIRADSKIAEELHEGKNRIEETVILVETKETLLSRKSRELLFRFAEWKKRKSGRFIVLFYPYFRDDDSVAGLYADAIMLGPKNLIVEYNCAN